MLTWIDNSVYFTFYNFTRNNPQIIYILVVLQNKKWQKIKNVKTLFIFTPPLKNDARGILHLGLFVCECVPKTLWTPYLQNQLKEFHPFLVRDANVLIDALISLIIWGERVNGQAHRRQQPEKLVNTISQKPVREFHPILARDANGLIDVLISFWGERIKDSKVMVTAGNDQKTLWTPCLKKTNEGNVAQFWSQMYLGP